MLPSIAQVAVRCRPINADEEKRGFVPIVSTDTERRQVKINYGPGLKKITKNFHYDRVFGRFATQEDVFKHTVAPMVDEVLAGFSCTAFAYGQTGTGKTHTMEGVLDSPKGYGIIPRAILSIFEKLNTCAADFTVRVSYLEIYQENLEDLLEASPHGLGAGSKALTGGTHGAVAGGGKSKGLRLMEDVRKGVQVLGLEDVNCRDAASTVALLQRGVTNRQTAATLCNKNSSRSHSVFTLKVVIKETNGSGEEEVRAGQLNLVDLAGSECIGRSGAKNERAREAGNINQSLLTLGRCITALTEGHPHIPYRDSKLTRLLQESLGGRAKTCIIATLSPVASNVDETLSTLEYALKAKSIKNKPELNARSSSRTLIKEYNSEIESLKSMLMATREKNGVYLAPAEYDQLQAQLQAQAERIKESEQALRQREEELEEAVGARTELRQQVESVTEALQQSEVAREASCEEARRLSKEVEKTKAELAGTRAVVAEQVQTEEALRGQGRLLLQSLGLARADVEGLLAKIERTGEILRKRCDGAADLGASCTAYFNHMRDGIKETGERGSSAASAMEQAVKDLVEKEVQVMGDTLKSLCGEVDSLVTVGGEASGRVGRDMCARLSKEIVDVLVRECQDQTQTMLECATRYGQVAEDRAREVSSAFEETTKAVTETLGSTLRQVEEGCARIQRVTAAHAKSADQVESHLKQYAASRQTEIEDDAKNLGDFMNAQEEVLKEGAEALLQNMQAELTNFLAGCSQSRKVYTDKMAMMAEKRKAGALEFATMTTVSLNEMKTDLARGVEGVLSSTLDPSQSLLRACVNNLDKSFTPHHAQALAAVDAESKQLVARLETTTAEGDRKMQERLASGVAVIKSIEAETSRIEALLQSKGVGVSAAMAAAEREAAVRLKDQSGAFTEVVRSALSDPLESQLNSLLSHVSQAEGAVSTYTTVASTLDGRTDKTPQKRKYREPETLSSTRPHAEIMAGALSSMQEADCNESAREGNEEEEKSVGCTSKPLVTEEDAEMEDVGEDDAVMSISLATTCAGPTKEADGDYQEISTGESSLKENDASPPKKRRLSPDRQSTIEEKARDTLKSANLTAQPTVSAPARSKTSRIPRPVKPLGSNSRMR
jgi:kinesin family protein 11